MRFPVAEVLPGDGERGELLGALVDHDDTICIAKGEWAQKDGVEDAEDGGVTSDAEGEGEDCDGGEDFGAAQLADGELQVSKQAQGYLAMRVRCDGGWRAFGQVSHTAAGRKRIFGARCG